MGLLLSFNRESVDLGTTADLDFVMTCMAWGVVKKFDYLNVLQIKRLKADNSGEYEIIAVLKEVNGIKQPAFPSPKPGDLTTKEATVEGSYNATIQTVTLTLTFKVSRMVCSDERQYVCEGSIGVSNGTKVITHNFQQSKNLTVKAHPLIPTMIARNITSGLDIPNQGFSPTTMASFMEGQVVQLACSGSIGSDPIAVLSWRKTSSLNGELQSYNPPPSNKDDGTAGNLANCQYQRTAWIRYNTTSADAARDSVTNPLYFECYIQSGNYSTPEADRPKFYIHVENGNTGIHQGGNGGLSTGTIVIGGSIAAVAFLAVVVVVVILWKRGICPFSRKEAQTDETKGPASHAYKNCSNIKGGQLDNFSDSPVSFGHAVRTLPLYTNTNIAVDQISGVSQYDDIDHDNQTDQVYSEINPTGLQATEDTAVKSIYTQLHTKTMEENGNEYSKLHVDDDLYLTCTM